MELAESVRASVGNDWEITLRDARFSDGKAVTTDDVVYTFEALLDPKTGGAARAHPPQPSATPASSASRSTTPST